VEGADELLQAALNLVLTFNPDSRAVANLPGCPDTTALQLLHNDSAARCLKSPGFREEQQQPCIQLPNPKLLNSEFHIS
jgi:hypothetical protein